jgi:hypothetical protein
MLRSWLQRAPKQVSRRNSVARLRVEALEVREAPAVFTVLPGDVSNRGTGTVGGLVWAINQADANGQDNAIKLAARSTYDLTAVDNFWYGPTGLPAISDLNGGGTHSLTIEGSGATVQRNTSAPAFRLFYVSDGLELPAGHLVLDNLTLTGGRAQGGNGGSGDGGGGGGAGLGGAVFNQGQLEMTGVTLLDNLAHGGAGGDYVAGSSGSGGGGGLGESGGSGTTADAGGGGFSLSGAAGGAGGAGIAGTEGAGASGQAGTSLLGGNGASGANGGGGGGGFRTTDNATGPGGAGLGMTGSPTTATNIRGDGGAAFYDPAHPSSVQHGGGGAFGGGGGSAFAGASFAGGGGIGGGGGGGPIGGGGGFGAGGGGGRFGGAGYGGLGGGGGGVGDADGGSGIGYFDSGFGGGNGDRAGGGGAGLGGALFNQFGTVTLTDCTLAMNSAVGGDGGLDAQVDGSRDSGGSGYGAAVFNVDGAVLVTNCTISGNTVATGAGSVSFLPPPSANGADVFNLVFGANLDGSPPSAYTVLANSILANAVGGDDVATKFWLTGTGSAAIAASAPNIVQAGGAAVTGIAPIADDPLLGPLQNNGGPTATMELLSGSPALGAGDEASAPLADQRGVTRTNRVDLGAYQASANRFALTGPASVNAGASTSVGVSAVDRFGKLDRSLNDMIYVGSTSQAKLPAAVALSGGTATVPVTLYTAGNQTVTVTDYDAEIEGTKPIHVQPLAAMFVTPVAGSGQTGFAGSAFDTPLQVRVTDVYGNPVPGAQIKFTSPRGAAGDAFGSANGPATVTVTTDALGLATSPTMYALLTPGSFTVTAGLPNKMPVSFALNTVPRPGETSTKLDAKPTSGVAFQSVTFTANVHVDKKGSANLSTAAGTVTFTDGDTELGTVKLASGQAILTTTALTAGNHDITATYNATPDFNGSVSNDVGVHLNAAAATVKLATITAPHFGDTINLSATVAAKSPSTGAPSGNVTFKDGSTVLGTAAISNGVATFPISTLAIGSHTIEADYQGSSDFLTAASPGQTFSVLKAIPTVTVSYSPSIVRLNHEITFTATVGAVNGVTPTGQVKFTLNRPDGGTTTSTVDLVNGQVSVKHTFNTIGKFSITADYLGDSTYAEPRTAALLKGTVSKDLPTVLVQFSPSSVTTGNQTTFTATVTSTTGVIPTGKVTFTIKRTTGTNPTPFTVDLVNGVATGTHTFTVKGDFTIIAEYLGDGTYLDVKSPLVSGMVN